MDRGIKSKQGGAKNCATTGTIQPAFDVLLAVADAIFPIELRDVERAKAAYFTLR
ncbi:MAG: hypothetical protein HY700_10870 [Gemmatimonadetes bacterium]|nr:hypothetical protein [Gemmatimonadota bacterium]